MKKKLITSALPYVNNEPHLGNIIGCVLSADTYARFCRSQGYETLYICATDEYGTPIVTKAMELGLTPKETCDKYHELHKKVYEHFNIQFDVFGRTTCEEHIGVTQDIYKKLEKEGYILEQETEQLYCEHDQMFLADRYIKGKCPHCHYEEARGDQCDSCGKLLQPTELLQSQCKLCGNNPTVRKTRHLYIDLPKIEKKLVEYHNTTMQKGNWPKNSVTATKGWIEKGLQPRPITRDLKWGIPVPREGYEEKVFYVWFDAPIGYISTTAYGFPDTWKNWWMDPENTELVQFMAKDNIPFHTVMFPACLLATKESWTLLHHISSVEYLNYENNKFSKSNNIGVFGTDVIESDIPVDLWRFYLLHNRPERADTNFLWDSFFEEANNTFIDNIGNLINRSLVFLHKRFGGTLKEGPFSSEQKDFLDLILSQEKEIVDLLEKVQIKDALKAILALGKAANKFFQDQAPWTSIKTDPEGTLGTISVLTYLVRDLAIMLEPYMPQTSEKIFQMLGVQPTQFQELGHWDSLKNHTIKKPDILFGKLDKKKVTALKEKFSGKREQEKDLWEKIEIKVGQVKSVNRHPDAERLFVEEIDCGEEEVRTIVSGLVGAIKEEEFIGKKVLVASNLATATIRGVQSQGMVLVAEKGKQMEIIDMADFLIGEIAYREGESPLTPEGQITIDEFFANPVLVEKNRLFYLGKKLMLNGKEISTQNLEKGTIK